MKNLIVIKSKTETVEGKGKKVPTRKLTTSILGIMPLVQEGHPLKRSRMIPYDIADNLAFRDFDIEAACWLNEENPEDIKTIWDTKVIDFPDDDAFIAKSITVTLQAIGFVPEVGSEEIYNVYLQYTYLVV